MFKYRQNVPNSRTTIQIANRSNIFKQLIKIYPDIYLQQDNDISINSENAVRRLQNKYKKYKCLFNILSLISIIELVLLVYVIIKKLLLKLKWWDKPIEEIKKIEEFRKIILNHGNNTEEDYEVLYDIFFNQIPKMKISKIVDSVNPIGGKGKELALRDIVKKCNIEGDKNAIMYSGDSITDVEALQYAKDNDGLAISFNGNEYAINAANIAVISDNAIMTAILRDLFIKYETKEILKFVKKYHDKGPDVAFDCYEVDSNLVSQFEELYKSKEIPVMDVINDENKEYLLDLSKKMRVEIRGDDIGGLG